jgi:hypothetical protein
VYRPAFTCALRLSKQALEDGPAVAWGTAIGIMRHNRAAPCISLSRATAKPLPGPIGHRPSS